MNRHLALRIASLCLLLLVITGMSFPDEKKAKDDADAPVAFGMLTQNAGCVIFHESKKTTGMFYGVAVTTHSFYVLDVIETQNYQLSQTQWKEDQDGLNQLQRIATTDNVKFVKLPAKKYTPEQLAKARSMCTESQKQPSEQATPPKP